MRRDYKDQRTLSHYRSNTVMVESFKKQQGVVDHHERLATHSSHNEQKYYHRGSRMNSPAPPDSMEIQLLFKANKREKGEKFQNRSSAKLLNQSRQKPGSRANEAFEEIKQ